MPQPKRNDDDDDDNALPLAPAVSVERARLSASLQTIVASAIVVLGGVISLAIFHAKLSAHMENPHVHLDPKQVTEGGGLAYRQDLYDEHARMRLLLKSMTIECRRVGGKETAMSCRVDLPEFPRVKGSH